MCTLVPKDLVPSYRHTCRENTNAYDTLCILKKKKKKLRAHLLVQRVYSVSPRHQEGFPVLHLSTVKDLDMKSDPGDNGSKENKVKGLYS